MSALASQLFPTVGAIDEEQMIGRERAVQSLVDRMTGRRDALIVEPRQVGKTSVLRAAMQRSRRSTSAVIAHADVKSGGIETSTQLGAALLASAAEHGMGGVAAAGTRVRMAATRTGRVVLAPLEAVASAAEVLGVPAEVGQVVGALREALNRAEVLPLDRVLAVLEADARLRTRPTVVVLDEVQEVAAWDADGRAVEDALAGAARRAHRRLVFVFAGSERHALEGLFATGRPLRVLSDRFPLPGIAVSDWLAGLRARFLRGGLQVDDRTLAALLEASRGHPLCTMHAAKEAFLAAQADGASTVEPVHVDTGLALARRQLWWEGFTRA